MDEGEDTTATFGGKVYQYFQDSGVVMVTETPEEGDPVVKYYSGHEDPAETNLVNLGDNDVAYVAIDGTELSLTAGVELLESPVTKVMYGTTENYTGEHIIELTENNTLTAAENAEIPEGLTINVGEQTALTTDFAATVSTTNGEVTVNGDTYTNANANEEDDEAKVLQIDTQGAENDTTVLSGAVTVSSAAEDKDVIGTNDENMITATNGDINVTFAEGVATTISVLDETDKFQVGETAEPVAGIERLEAVI